MPVRGATFTPQEDEALAKACISASEDPIVGAEQKVNDFFAKVQCLYNETFKPANKELRSLESLKVRCRSMHKECMTFAGCHARIVRLNPSGASSNDIVRMATGAFNGRNMTSVDDECGKPFKFLSAGKVLRGHQKFMGALQERRGGSLTSSKSKKNVEQSTRVGREDKDDGYHADGYHADCYHADFARVQDKCAQRPAWSQLNSSTPFLHPYVIHDKLFCPKLLCCVICETRKRALRSYCTRDRDIVPFLRRMKPHWVRFVSNYGTALDSFNFTYALVVQTVLDHHIIQHNTAPRDIMNCTGIAITSRHTKNMPFRLQHPKRTFRILTSSLLARYHQFFFARRWVAYCLNETGPLRVYTIRKPIRLIASCLPLRMFAALPGLDAP